MLLLFQSPFTDNLHLIIKIVYTYTDTKWRDSNERIIEKTYRKSESVTYGIVSIMVSMNTSLYILYSLLQVEHLRINGLREKFDNYHSKKKGFLGKIWIPTQTMILTLQNAL